jgi:hypothetical protein
MLYPYLLIGELELTGGRREECSLPVVRRYRAKGATGFSSRGVCP